MLHIETIVIRMHSHEGIVFIITMISEATKGAKEKLVLSENLKTNFL